MMSAPAKVDARQLRDIHVKVDMPAVDEDEG